MIEAARLIGTALTLAGIGIVFIDLILSVVVNPRLREQLFSYAILGFVFSEARSTFVEKYQNSNIFKDTYFNILILLLILFTCFIGALPFMCCNDFVKMQLFCIVCYNLVSLILLYTFIYKRDCIIKSFKYIISIILVKRSLCIFLYICFVFIGICLYFYFFARVALAEESDYILPLIRDKTGFSTKSMMTLPGVDSIMNGFPKPLTTLSTIMPPLHDSVSSFNRYFISPFSIFSYHSLQLSDIKDNIIRLNESGWVPIFDENMVCTDVQRNLFYPKISAFQAVNEYKIYIPMYIKASQACVYQYVCINRDIDSNTYSTSIDTARAFSLARLAFKYRAKELWRESDYSSAVIESIIRKS